jgi:hypothetical protein
MPAEHAVVHLSRTGDHVLHEVRMTETVDMGVVPPLGFVRDVSRNDGDRLRLVAHDATHGDLLVGLVSGKPFLRLNARMAETSVVLPWSM